MRLAQLPSTPWSFFSTHLSNAPLIIEEMLFGLPTILRPEKAMQSLQFVYAMFPSH